MNEVIVQLASLSDGTMAFIALAGLLTFFYVNARNEKRDKRKGGECS